MEIDIQTIAAIIAFTSIALVIDLKTRRIPNWLTVSTAVSGLAYHVFIGGWSGLWFSLAGFGTGFGVLLILWLIGGGGGGDVKLMGGVGAWMGALPTLIIFIASAVFAVVCTVVVILWSRHRNKRNSALAAAKTENNPVLKQTIPYALPVAMSIWSLFVYRLIQG